MAHRLITTGINSSISEFVRSNMKLHVLHVGALSSVPGWDAIPVQVNPSICVRLP